MGTIIGVVLSIGGGIAFGTSISRIARLGSCIGDCAAQGAFLPWIIGGFVAVFVAAFLWRYAMVAAPVAGLLAAAVVLTRDGVDLFGANLGFTAFIAACVLLGPAIVLLVGLWGAARRKRAQQITRDGLRAVAEVQSVQGTTVQINNRPLVEVTYLLHPLDGSPPFLHSKSQTIGYSEVVPRPGLRWPAWYLPHDRDAVAVGAPTASLADPQTQALLQEFGIAPAQAYGYDPTAAGPVIGTFGAGYQGSPG